MFLLVKLFFFFFDFVFNVCLSTTCWWIKDYQYPNDHYTCMSMPYIWELWEKRDVDANLNWSENEQQPWPRRQELTRRWDSEREHFYDDIVHAEASNYAHWIDFLISTIIKHRIFINIRQCTLHLLIQLGTHAFKPLKYHVNVYHIKR